MSALEQLSESRGRRRFGHAVRIFNKIGQSTEAWLAFRKETGIGSSDASSVLGYNPYRSARQAYDEYLGIAPSFEGNEATECGTLLEEPGAILYTRRTGNRVENVNAVLQHPDYPFMVANVDRAVVGSAPQKILEVKTAGVFAHMHGDWGAPEIEPDRIPTQYLCQIQHLLAVTGYQCADLALLVGGQKFFVYPDIPRDESFIDSMIKIEGDFWKNVVAGREILFEFASAYGIEHTAMLAAIRDAARIDSLTFEREAELRSAINSELAPFRPLPGSYDEASKTWASTSKAIQATPAAARAFDDFCDLKERESALKKDIDSAQLALANYMQDCDELLIDGKPVLTWRTQTRKAFSVAESTSRPMRRVKGK